MGYRSDVTCIMYGKGKAEQIIINEWIRQRIAGRDDEDSFQLTDDLARFDAEQWKWYPDYNDVKFLNNLFNEFVDTFIEGEGDNDPQYALEFVRVGEDYSDIESRYEGRCEFRLHVARVIEVLGKEKEY